jgi:hypothetical protein
MCEYISPSQSERELFFVALKINQRKGLGITGNESLAWYSVFNTQIQISTTPLG